MPSETRACSFDLDASHKKVLSLNERAERKRSINDKLVTLRLQIDSLFPRSRDEYRGLEAYNVDPFNNLQRRIDNLSSPSVTAYACSNATPTQANPASGSILKVQRR